MKAAIALGECHVAGATSIVTPSAAFSRGPKHSAAAGLPARASFVPSGQTSLSLRSKPDQAMFLSQVRASHFRRLTPSVTASASAAAPSPSPVAAPPEITGDDLALAEQCFGVGHEILGIDIGGTSIKAAPVDTRSGTLLAPKHVIMTPKPATPEGCAEVLAQMVEHFQWKGAVGVGVPAVVRQGTTQTAANIDKSWIGAEVESLFSARLGLPTTVVNDADAAGYAELGFGSGKGENERGVVFVVTFGTGIGTAMFVDGILVPNLELGHIELDGGEAEHAAAGILVERNQWSWEQWAGKVSWYLAYIERLFWPTLFIVGGGVSNAHEKWLHLVTLPHGTRLVPASMKNDAGIVGAAMAALARAAYDIKKKPSFVEEYINA